MIKYIILKGFQSHKYTKIKFVPGVNALIGNTDAGKTAVLRAFYWVIYNRPMGDEFMSNWADEMSVTILFEDGIKITRGRDKQGNYYKLNGLKDPLRAFKQEVPIEIQQALNLSEINIQSQMDAPFLLSSNSGEVAQTLNKVVHLDIIDKAQSKLRKKKTAVDTEYKNLLASIKSHKKALKEYRYLKQMEADVILLESAKVCRATLARQFAGLYEIGLRMQESQEIIQKNSRILRVENRLCRVLALVDDKVCQEKKISELERILETVKIKYREIKEWQNKEKELHEKFDQLFPDVCPLCGK